MSIAFLDSSIENQKGGYLKPNQIKLLKYPFHVWHLYCLRVALCLSLPPHFPCSLRSDKCHRSGQGCEICGRHPRARFVCSGQLGWNQSRWKQIEANGQTEGSTSSDDYTMGHRSPCCIYCVTSSSKCEGSCPGAWHIHPEVWWYNTHPPNLK